MAKAVLCLVLLAAFGFTVTQLVRAEQQQQNRAAIAPDVEVQPKSEQVQFRSLREADAKKKKKVSGKKSKNGKSKKGNNTRKKSVRNIKRKCKKCRKGRKGRKRGGKRGGKMKRTQKKKKNEKKKKGGQKINSNSVQKNTPIICPNGCVQISTNYKKFRTSLNQANRIIRSCGLIKKKYDKALNGTFNAAGNAICTKNKHQTISKNLLNCNDTASSVCTPPEACSSANIDKYTACKNTIQTYQDGYTECLTPKTQTDQQFCLCVQKIANLPESDCLTFSSIDTIVTDEKKKCTGISVLGSFGYCRKLQQKAADECNCNCASGNFTTTAASNMTTSGPGGRKKFLRENFVKKWIKN